MRSENISELLNHKGHDEQIVMLRDHGYDTISMM
jgi:hypothetical protein